MKNKISRSIRIKNANIESSQPAGLTTILSQKDELGSPTNIDFSANQSSPTSLTVNWKAPAPVAPRNITVSRYFIEGSINNFESVILSQTSNTFITIDNLDPNANYTFRIRSQNDELVNGNPTLSPWSNIFTVSIKKWLLESPKNFKLESKIDLTNTVNLKWDRLTSDDSNIHGGAGKIAGYEIKWSGQIVYSSLPPIAVLVDDSKKISLTSSTDTELTLLASISNLYPGINYTFKVRAFNQSGVTTSWSNITNVKIEPIIPDSLDFDITASKSDTSSQATLSWIKPVTNYNIDAYEVYWYDSYTPWNTENIPYYHYAFKRFESQNVPTNSNGKLSVSINNFINFSKTNKPFSYTFRLRAVSYVPSNPNYPYNVNRGIIIPGGYSNIQLLAEWYVIAPFYDLIIINQPTMQKKVIKVEDTISILPIVNNFSINTSDIANLRVTINWVEPDTDLPFDYNISWSTNTDFINDPNQTNTRLFPKGTTSAIISDLMSNRVYYFKIGIPYYLKDNVITWSITKKIYTLIRMPEVPEKFNFNVFNIGSYNSQQVTITWNPQEIVPAFFSPESFAEFFDIYLCWSSNRSFYNENMITKEKIERFTWVTGINSKVIDMPDGDLIYHFRFEIVAAFNPNLILVSRSYIKSFYVLSKTPYNAYNIKNNAPHLCYQILGGLDSQGDKIPYSNYNSFDTRDQLKCGGWRQNWYVKKTPVSEAIDLGTGYSFYKLSNTWGYYGDFNKWVDHCASVENRDKVGRGGIAVMRTARQINSFNNPSASILFDGISISQWLLTQFNNTQDNIKNALPNLTFNEDIFYVEPQDSPLVYNDTTIYIKKSRNENLIVDIEQLISDSVRLSIFNNTSNVSTLEFHFEFSSDNVDIIQSNYIAEPDNKSYTFYTLKKTGSFVISAFQFFYQNKEKNVAYKEKRFFLKCDLTITE